jgi:succinyl-CoA synthetase beta subunit
MQVLEAVGLSVPARKFVLTADEGAAAFDDLGSVPVVLKVMSYQIPHKSDVGALRLGVDRREDVARVVLEMLAEVDRHVPEAEIEGLLVQQMRPGRFELCCGMHRDRTFGPMVLLGLGGAVVELLAETVMLKPPFGDEEARRAIHSLCAGRLVSSPRGLTDSEIENLVVIARVVGELGMWCDGIRSIDINPIRVHQGTLVAVDALIEVAPTGS